MGSAYMPFEGWLLVTNAPGQAACVRECGRVCARACVHIHARVQMNSKPRHLGFLCFQGVTFWEVSNSKASVEHRIAELDGAFATKNCTQF